MTIPPPFLPAGLLASFVEDRIRMGTGGSGPPACPPSTHNLKKQGTQHMAEGTREVPYPEVDIAVVRKYANRRANASSVRGIARRIGIRHTSFDKFLAGSEPYVRNRTLLCEWYLREHRVHPTSEPTQAVELVSGPPVEDGLSLMDRLLSDFRGEARTEARLRITSALAQGYRRMGLGEPEWLYRT